MSKLIQVTLGGHLYKEVEVAFQLYADPAAGMALQLKQGWEPLATASVNMAPQGYTPQPGCFYLKDYGENDGMLESLIDAGVVEDTGRSVQAGWARVHEVRWAGEWACAAAEFEKDARSRRLEMLKEVVNGGN